MRQTERTTQTSPRARVKGDRGSARGFALIEMAIAASILMIGALTFLQLFGASSRVGNSNRETALSTQAAQRTFERLDGFEPFDLLYELHNVDPDDDPMGEAPLPGFTLAGFEVEGLIPVDGDADGLVGELIFPIDPLSGVIHADYRAEDFTIAASLLGGGLPAEVSDAYDKLLPVVVRVDWQSNGMVRRYEVVGLLSPR